ncbi:MAG: phosphate acetyltransferase [Pseudomonadota bacterium]
MKLGDRAEVQRRFTKGDVAAYIDLGGAPPDRRAVPEPMIAALFSYLLGVKKPGPGTNYLKQSLAFQQAAATDDLLTASVEITRLRPEKALADLETICRNEAGEVICTGRALVRVKDVSSDSD